jgi:hypothetical protein
MHRTAFCLLLLCTGCPEEGPPGGGGADLSLKGGPDASLSRRWLVVRPPSPGAPNLFSLFGDAPDRLWAAGSAGTLLRIEPQGPETAGSSGEASVLADGLPALRFTETPVPEAARGQDLTYVHGSAPNDVYAVGTGGVILRHDGATWQREVPKKARPEDPDFNADLWGVYAYPGGAIAVGNGGVWVRRDNAKGGWEAPQKLPVQSLLRVWGVDGKNVYAVGSVGYIFRYNGSTWSPVSPPGFTNKLAGIFGSATSNVYAVGLSGSVLRSTGGTFSDYGAQIDPRCGPGALPKTFLRAGAVLPDGQILVIGWEGVIARILPAKERCADGGMAPGVVDEGGATTHRLEGLFAQGGMQDLRVYLSGAEGIVLRGR